MISRPTVVLAGSASVTILVSFATQWYLLTRLGATRQLDAYFAALAVPLFMLYVVGDPVFKVALPQLAVRDGRVFREYAWMFARTVGVLFVTVGLVLGLAAPIWVPLLTPGFLPAEQRLVVTLVRTLLIGMVLQGLSGVARTVWNGRNSFVFPALTSTAASLVGLVFLVLTVGRYGITAAAWAFNARFFTECVGLLPVLGSWTSIRGSAADMRRLLRHGRPLILGGAYARTDVLVDRVLASMAPVGSLSLLYLAQQILAAVGQVLNQSFVAPVGPGLARLASTSQWGAFTGVLRRRSVNLGVLVICGALMIPLSGPALHLLFAHKNMDAEHIRRLMVLLIALSGLLLGDSLAYLANTAFYALGERRTPSLATGIVYSLVVPMKILVFSVAGIVGLAVCTSGYYLTNLLVLAYFLRRTVRRAAHGAPLNHPPSLFQTPSPQPEVVP